MPCWERLATTPQSTKLQGDQAHVWLLEQCGLLAAMARRCSARLQFVYLGHKVVPRVLVHFATPMRGLVSMQKQGGVLSGRQTLGMVGGQLLSGVVEVSVAVR